MTNSQNMSHKAKETYSNLKSMIAALYKLTSLRAAILQINTFTVSDNIFLFLFRRRVCCRAQALMPVKMTKIRQLSFNWKYF